MKEYLINLKNKYNYDNQMIETIGSIINAFVNVLGEEYYELILNAIDKTVIIQYDNSITATNIINQIINDGNNHIVDVKADKSGFMEDYYTYEGNEIKQNFIIGISNFSPNKLSMIVHELCHVFSTIGKFKIEGNTILIGSGFNISSRKFINGKIGDEVSNKGEIFNEIITENLSMQIMDNLEPDITHEPSAYNGYVNNFKGIFRDESINKIIISSYLRSSSDFLLSLENIISKEKIDNEIYALCNDVDLNNGKIKDYLEYIKSLSVKEFFELYIDYCNHFFKAPEGIDKQMFKLMKSINSTIVYNISQNLVERNYSK